MATDDADETLTDSEIQLLRALATDRTLEVIARELGLSESTLRRRSRLLFERLGVSNRLAAALWAARRGLV